MNYDRPVRHSAKRACLKHASGRQAWINTCDSEVVDETGVRWRIQLPVGPVRYSIDGREVTQAEFLGDVAS